MSALYPQNWEGYLPVFLIFLRLLGLFMLIPGFSHQSIPARFKVLLSMVTALGLYPMLKSTLPPLQPEVVSIVVAVLRELVFGFVMGLASHITFEALALGAQFIGTQIGFGMAGIFDPQHESNTSVIVALKGWLVLMIFFALDIHHQILHLFISSFAMTRNITESHLGDFATAQSFIKISGKLFVMAIQVAAPFTFLVLASNAAIGVLSRMMPQINILLFSFPITITLGLLALYIIAPDYLDFVENALSLMAGDMILLLKAV